MDLQIFDFCYLPTMLFENGKDTLAKFVAFVTSEDELTKVLKASFVLDPESSLKVRGQVASYLVASQTAKTRIKMQAEAEATSELREWAKPIRRVSSRSANRGSQPRRGGPRYIDSKRGNTTVAMPTGPEHLGGYVYGL